MLKILQLNKLSFEDVSIKNKLIGIIFLSLMGLAGILAFVVTQKSQDTLIEDKFNQLETIEFTKHAELKKYFSTLKNLLTITAQNSQTKLALDAFIVSFKNIQKETSLYKEDIQKDLILDYNINYINKINFNIPNVRQQLQTKNYLPESLSALVAQKVFILDNPAKIGEKNLMSDSNKYQLTYINNHRLFHPIYNNLLNTFNLYDIVLMDCEGNVVYTTFKEKEFATNLNTGIYKNSGLAKAYHKALKLKVNHIAFEDFKPYEPSYNKPASFISTPIYSNDKIIGVIAFQLPSEQLTNIMQFNKEYKKAGLGETGEAYLVGSDYKMRTNSRFVDSMNEDSEKIQGSTIGIKIVKTKSVESIIDNKGHRGHKIIKDYRNKDVLSVYHTVHPFGKKDVSWAIIAEMNKDEVLKPIGEIINFMIFTTSVLLLIFLYISFTLIQNIINKPLENFHYGLEHFFLFLNGTEKSTKYLRIKSNDEIGKMSDSINKAIKKISKNLDKENDQLWIKEGLRQLNQQFIQANKLEVITDKTLSFLSSYIKNINIGVIFLYDRKKEQLILNNSYSFSIGDTTQAVYKLKEGVVGEVAFKKEEILLRNNIINSNMRIQSGTKQTIPHSTYTFPLLYNGVLYGVIELGSISNLKEKEIELVRVSTKIIATAISTAMKNNEVEELLKESNEININLSAKQKEIEVANNKMKLQQEQLEIQNKELNITQIEVEKKAKDLEQSNKYKTEFMANMSHELRTPLNAVILLSELMGHNKQKNLNSDDIKKANTINTAGKDLLRLIDDILDLSKVEAGKIEIIVDEFKPLDLLEELKDLYEQSAINKDLTFNIHDSYVDTIRSDKHRISQILKNLISNALKFTKTGSIDVSIIKSEDENLPIKISVKDSGIGISQDKLEKIFEAFTQEDGSTSRQYGGTGLGLSITKELSALLGGKVIVESSKNIGSTFIILLPNINNLTICDTPYNETKKQENPTIQKELISEEVINAHEANDNPSVELIQDHPTILEDIDLTNLNILVVDDDIKNIFIIDGVLQDYNVNVFTAYNGNEAMEVLKETPNIDIILMDIMMPVMDGFEAIKLIKQDDKINNIPIIAVSAITLKEDIDKCISLGANDYVSKPINIESFLKIIDIWSQKN